MPQYEQPKGQKKSNPTVPNSIAQKKVTEDCKKILILKPKDFTNQTQSHHGRAANHEQQVDTGKQKISTKQKKKKRQDCPNHERDR